MLVRGVDPASLHDVRGVAASKRRRKSSGAAAAASRSKATRRRGATHVPELDLPLALFREAHGAEPVEAAQERKFGRLGARVGLVDLAYDGLGARVAESQLLVFGRRRPDLALVVPDDVLDELLVFVT